MKQKEAPIGWVIGVGVAFVVAVLLVLAGLGFTVYYAVDAICVAADPNNASALCQDISD